MSMISPVPASVCAFRLLHHLALDLADKRMCCHFCHTCGHHILVYSNPCHRKGCRERELDSWDCQAMFNFLDRDKSGALSFQEFLEIGKAVILARDFSSFRKSALKSAVRRSLMHREVAMVTDI